MARLRMASKSPRWIASDVHVNLRNDQGSHAGGGDRQIEAGKEVVDTIRSSRFPWLLRGVQDSDPRERA